MEGCLLSVVSIWKCMPFILCWNAVDFKRVAIKVAYCLFFRQMKESLLREICHIRLLALSTMCITFTQVDSYPHFIQLRLMKHSNGIWEKTKITILSAFIKKGGWEVGIYGVPSTMCYATSWVSMCKKNTVSVFLIVAISSITVAKLSFYLLYAISC